MQVGAVCVEYQLSPLGCACVFLQRAAPYGGQICRRAFTELHLVDLYVSHGEGAQKFGNVLVLLCQKFCVLAHDYGMSAEGK